MTGLRDKVIRIIGEALDLDETDKAVLESDTVDHKIDRWDSTGHVEVILALEDAFGVEIEVEQIARLNHVNKIVDYLESRGGDADMREAG